MDESRGESRPGDVEKKPILDTSVLKAFVAGIIAGNLNKGLVLGFAIGDRRASVTALSVGVPLLHHSDNVF